MRAADAVAPNLPYPPEERLPVMDVKPLARSKCSRRRRGTPTRSDPDCGSQWRFLRVRACAPPRILGGVESWRIDYLLTQKLYRNGNTKPDIKSGQHSRSNPGKAGQSRSKPVESGRSQQSRSKPVETRKSKAQCNLSKAQSPSQWLTHNSA